MKHKRRLLRRIAALGATCVLLICFFYKDVLFYGKASELSEVLPFSEAEEIVAVLPDAPGDVDDRALPDRDELTEVPPDLPEPETETESEDDTADRDVLQEIVQPNDDEPDEAAPRNDEPEIDHLAEVTGEMPPEDGPLEEASLEGGQVASVPFQFAQLPRPGRAANRTVTMDFEDLDFGSDNKLYSKKAVYPLKTSKLIVTDARQDLSLGDWSLRLSASAFNPVTGGRSAFHNALYLNGAMIGDQKMEIMSAPASDTVTTVDLMNQSETGWNSGFEIVLNPGQASRGQYKSVLNWELVYAPFVETISVSASLTADTDSQVSWTEVADAEYWVYRSVGSPDNYQLVASYPDHSVFHSEVGLDYDTTYYYRVDAMRDGAVVTSGEAFVTTGKLQPPAEKPVVIAAGLDTSRIEVKWDAIDGAVGYLVYRSDSQDGTYSLKTTVQGTDWIDIGLPEDTGYYYKVEAFNTAGTGPRSDYAYAKTLLDPPSTPLDIVADGISASEIIVSWDPVSGAAGYIVYRADKENGGFTEMTQVVDNYWLNEGLPADTGYYYKVSAYNDAGESIPSNTAYGRTLTSPPASAPPNVQAVGISTSEIYVTWDPVPDALGYIVYRSDTQNGPYNEVQQALYTFWINEGLPTDTGYYYKVEAFNDGGAGPRSGDAYGKTMASIPQPPASAPPNVKADGVSTSEILVTWSAVSGATGYNIYRSSSANGTFIRMTQVNGTMWTNAGLLADTGYYYKVEAFNADGTGPQSSAAYGKTLAGSTPAPPPSPSPNPTPKPPASAPLNVKAEGISTSAIKVSWNAVSGATGYVVYRGNSSTGTFTRMAQVSGITWTNVNLPADTGYYYKVEAYNADGTGPRSNAAYGRTKANAAPAPTPPASAPPNVKAEGVSTSQIKVTWSAVSGATGYIVYRSGSLNGTYTKMTQVTGTTWTNVSLPANTGYYYKVEAYNAAGIGPRSAGAYGKTKANPTPAPTPTPPPTVTGPTPPPFWLSHSAGDNGANAGQFNIAIEPWNQNDRYSFALYKSTSVNGPYTLVNKIVPNWGNINKRPQTFSFAHVYNDPTKYAVGTVVYYRVASIDKNGKEGPKSDYLMWKAGYPESQQDKSRLGSPPADLGVIK